MAAATLYDKLWDDHVVRYEGDTALLYIDRQLIHEVTSPQAFEGLRIHGRRPRRPEANLAVPDHNVPTTRRAAGITDPVARLQVETLVRNCAEFGITLFGMDDPRQGFPHPSFDQFDLVRMKAVGAGFCLKGMLEIGRAHV